MIRISTLIVISALILGCEKEPTADKGPTTDDCVDPPITPININFAKNDVIRVSPGAAEAHRGNVLRFKLTGDNEATVHIRGKESYPDSSWIKGEGMGGEFFYVCVDPDLEIPEGQKEKTYGYDIVIPGVGTLDPMVIVKR
jgi:hypothetical protein